MKYADLIKSKLGNKEINDYLSLSKNVLHYEKINLLDVVLKFGTPLDGIYTEIINEKIDRLKENFDKATKNFNYSGKYIYAYAAKANYYSEDLSTVLDNVDAIETTSSYDLDMVEYLVDTGLMTRETKVICNGFKHGSYLKKIIKLKKKGQNIMPILENEDEVEQFLKKTDLDFEVGMRLNLDDNLLKGKFDFSRLSSGIDSRFGFFFEDMRRLAKKINESKHLTLKTLHFHLGGTIEDLDVYEQLINFIYKNNYCVLKKEIETLEYFDVGGGLPVQYNLDFNFDYQKYADILIKAVVQISKEENVPQANIIGENGRYTVNDSGFFCFKIVISKKTKDKDTFWYFIDSSFMNFLPDSWALGQEFLILPLNGWEREAVKVRLGGVTCDPDDTYYKQDQDNFIYLPEMKDNEDLYIGIFGIGAYQEMISGVGGVHHCLLPQSNGLIIYRDDNGVIQFDKIDKLQSSKKVLNILDYNKSHDLERYKG